MNDIINTIPSKDISFRTKSLLKDILDRLELSERDRIDLQRYIEFGGGENIELIKNELENIPFEKGDAENSAVLKGGDNAAVLKGWYYSSIYKESNSIITVYLDSKQKICVVNEPLKTVAQTPDITLPNLANILGIGTIVSLVNDAKYDNKFKIIGGGNGEVRLQTIDDSNIPFNVIKAEAINEPEDYSIYCVSKPDTGMFDMGQGSIAIGYNNKATNGKATAFGYNNHAYGKFSFVEGRNNEAAYAAHAEGRDCIAKGEMSHAGGLTTHANGKASFSHGQDTRANGHSSFAMGYGAKANGEQSISLGYIASAEGAQSVATGNNTQAIGNVSHAENAYTIAEGRASHAEGFNSKVRLSEGSLTDNYERGVGYAAHAEGHTTQSIGCAAHSEGGFTTALGNFTHAEGYRTHAKGLLSHSEGKYTKTTNEAEHAEGKYNKSNTNTLHSVGIGTSVNDRKNAHEIMDDGKHYIYGVGGYDGTNPDTSYDLATYLPNMVNITYDELVALRNNSKLVPGQQYRITDYVTTTIQENTQSAGHQFDIIVTADDESTLNENARAIQHDGDTYFADSDLNAWQIWYCLDNDTSRFAWAKTPLYSPITNQKMIIVNDKGHAYIYVRDSSFDRDGKCAWLYDAAGDGKQFIDYITLNNESLDSSDIIYTDSEELEVGAELDMSGTSVMLADMSWTEGKGVIYRMIDEFNNDCPYDFKNIQFYRGVFDGGGIAPNGDEDMNFYLFTFSFRTDDNEIIDTSIFSNNGRLLNDEGQITGVYGNIIGQYVNYDASIDSPTKPTQRLNDIVFYSHYDFEGETYYVCYSNIFGNDCYSNSFGNDCHSNSFGNDCYSNSFGNDCYSNSFGNDCYSNSFGNDYHSNSFGNDCYSNSFGNDCYSNSFGNDCHSNSFGNDCYSNSFGDDCYSNSFDYNCYNNSFGNGCSNNSFGNSCSRNSFGNGCSNNSFGNNCYYNSFGNICSDNSFGNICSDNSFGNNCYYNSFGNNCYYNSFGNGCNYNSFRTNNSKTASLKAYCYYNHFDDGCSYNVIWNTTTASPSYKLQNININRGTRGTFSSHNMINIDVLNQDYEIQVAKNSKGEIKIYCEADLIA